MAQEEFQKFIEVIYGSDVRQAFMRGYAQGYAAAKLEPVITPFNPNVQPLRDAFGTDKQKYSTIHNPTSI